MHLFTAGFKEVEGDEGRELDDKIREIAQARGLAVVGPNGMGLYVPESAMVSRPGAPKESGSIGMLSQSGTLAQLFSSCALGAGFRFSKMISCLGGGIRVACADALAREGLETPTLSVETERQLLEFTPKAGMSVKSPLDFAVVYRDRALLDKTLDLVGADPRIDAFLVDLSFNLVIMGNAGSAGEDWFGFDAGKLGEFSRDNVYRKPLAVILGSMGYNEDVDRLKMTLHKPLREANLAVFPSIGRAARALSKFFRYYAYLSQTGDD